MKIIKNIAIVGAGPSGLSVYLQLIKELHSELEAITIFDPKGISNSYSFNTELESSLTNTSIGVTSLYADDKLDFFKWFQDKKPEFKILSTDFVSRFHFNEYAKDRFTQSKIFASSFGCPTNVVEKEVTQISYRDDRFIVEVSNNENHKYEFDAVILATGIINSVPDETYEKYENFISSAYPESNFLSRLSNRSNVLIIGSKLSAIDVAIAIHTHFPQAVLKMVSRSGELPAVRNSLLIKQSISAWESTFDKLSTQGPRSDCCVARKLASDIASCKSNLNEWENIIGQFVEELNDDFPTLSPSNQVNILSKYDSFIKQYVSSFPLRNAEIILKAFESNKLRVIKRNFSNYLYLHANRIYGKDNEGVEDFDLVINASGISNKALSDKLIHQLSIFSIQKNEKGGLRLDAKTMKVLSSHKDIDIPLYVIGGPANGEIPIINYVRASVVQAKKIVNNIMIAHYKDNKRHIANYV